MRAILNQIPLSTEFGEMTDNPRETTALLLCLGPNDPGYHTSMSVPYYTGNPGNVKKKDRAIPPRMQVTSAVILLPCIRHI